MRSKIHHAAVITMFLFALGCDRAVQVKITTEPVMYDRSPLIRMAGCGQKREYTIDYTQVTVGNYMDMRVLSQGPYRYGPNDIQTFVPGSNCREIGVQIRNGYQIGIREFDEPHLPGFGLLVWERNHTGKSWEWYQMGESNRAYKLQGSGDLLVDTIHRNNSTYVSKVTFLEDAVFRLNYPRPSQMNMLDAFASALKVDELFVIRKGSVLVFHEQ